ncbi:MAG TPA: NAD-dependent malic enzyme [Solirubrobacteraceae bacterium]|nr:NAD-dependent malic enzyme [Solirubrobacteraceae bacterium]
MPLDCTYRLRVPHRVGSLARVTGTIADCEGLIGDVRTIVVARREAIREITVEVRDLEHAASLSERLGALDGVHVIWYHDRAFIAHEGGKLRVEPVREVRSNQDMRDVYTPGVARVCTAIAEYPALARRFTTIGRTVAICTNGTRVLGLGDIGPLASMPVMEGKAMFYGQLAGISAVPVLIDTRDVDEFVETVVRIAPSFGGIHLEDISAPECFEIERRLIEALPQPVMHDDVHGTAVVSLAAAIVACREAGLRLDQAVVGQVGLGAAGFGIASLIHAAGAERVIATDPGSDARARAAACGIEPVEDLETVMREADVVIATTGVPGLIRPELVRKGQVILALSNPAPEITIDAALEAGAAAAADGTVVNNVLGYPGMFRGALLAGAKAMTTDMKRAAAWAIAGLTVESDQLVPDPLDPRVHEAVAEAVRQAAIDSGVADPDRTPSSLDGERVPADVQPAGGASRRAD